MLKRKPNVIQPVEQTVPDEWIDRKLRPESLIVPHVASLQIDRHLVVVNLLGSLYQLRNFGLGQPHGKESILGAVVGEDIRKRRRDHSPKAEVRQRPHRMLTRRSAPKIPSRNQNARTLEAWLMQHKVWILLSVSAKPPVVKHKLPKPGALDPLQELLGDNLVRIHIDSIQRRHPTAMYRKGFHRALLQKQDVRQG
jgi:hypothetical protein